MTETHSHYSTGRDDNLNFLNTSYGRKKNNSFLAHIDFTFIQMDVIFFFFNIIGFLDLTYNKLLSNFTFSFTLGAAKALKLDPSHEYRKVYHVFKALPTSTTLKMLQIIAIGIFF